MYFHAQTIIQLINHLRNKHYSSEEIILVIRSHRLAVSLFAGQFQSSGKTQIEHGVGTASVLCSLELPAELVAAGIVHNVYGTGDFGDGKTGVSSLRRRMVRKALGNKVEEYVHGFFTSRARLRKLSVSQIDALSEIGRGVMLLSLAEQLDHHIDLGRIYHRRKKETYQKFIRQKRDTMFELAERLGFPALASELDRVFRETLSTEIPVEILNELGPDTHHTVAPNSYRKNRSKKNHPRPVLKKRTK